MPFPSSSPGGDAAVRVRRHRRTLALGWGLRVCAAVVLVVSAAFLAPERLAVLGYALALVWAPLAGAVEAYRRRRPARHGAVLAMLLDAAMLVGALLVAPGLALAVLVVQLPLVAHHAQADGFVGWVAAAASLPVAAYGLGQLPLDRSSHLGGTLLYAVGLAGVLWMQGSASSNHSDMSVALRLASNRAEAVLAHIGDAVTVTGAGGRIHRLNPAAEQLFGCPGDAAVGARCHEILELRHDVAPLDCSGGCALLGAMPSSGAEGVEIYRILTNGSRQPLLATAREIRGPDGAVREVVHSFRDISELKRAEEAQSLFLATATHELKTPLTVIRGFAETLERISDLPLEQRQLAAERIGKHTDDLDRIIERLLLSSRIQAGRVDLATTEGLVGEHVFERVTVLREATARPLTLHLPERESSARFSPGALSTVLDHLLENAMKYSPAGDPVAVGVSVEDATVDISVSDQGIGMTAEQCRRCFDRFWQAEGDTARRFGGTGIGLYIVKSLVEAMGGEIVVDSAPGLGTTFVVRLERADHPTTPERADAPTHRGERTMVDEFMRQTGLREPAP